LETLAVFAPSEPTRFGSAMKIYKYIFAALTSLMFHVKPYEASEAETNIFVSISEPIKVAIVGQSPTCDSESRQTFFVRIEI
jgi:hypothetical protein